LFNAADLRQAVSDFGGLLGIGGLPLLSEETVYYLRSYALVFAVSIVGATPIIKTVAARLEGTKLGAILEPLLLLALLVVCTAYLVDGSFNPFLYFRF
jgi:alginate O-acetyltransferase complex protein AlgI